MPRLSPLFFCIVFLWFLEPPGAQNGTPKHSSAVEAGPPYYTLIETFTKLIHSTVLAPLRRFYLQPKGFFRRTRGRLFRLPPLPPTSLDSIIGSLDFLNDPRFTQSSGMRHTILKCVSKLGRPRLRASGWLGWLLTLGRPSATLMLGMAGLGSGLGCLFLARVSGGFSGYCLGSCLW